MKALSVLMISIFCGCFIFAQQQTPVDDSQALEFIKKSQIIVKKAIINAEDLAGCLIIEKSNEDPIYLNILPEDIRSGIMPTPQETTPFSTMLSKEESAQLGLLKQIGITLGLVSANKRMVQITINTVWTLKTPSFISSDKIRNNIFTYGKIYRQMGYKVSYSQNIQYSLLTTSIYEESSKAASGSFVYFDVSGKQYVQYSNFMQKEIISISPMDISALVDTFDWKTTPSLAVAPSVKPTSTIQNLDSIRTKKLGDVYFDLLKSKKFENIPDFILKDKLQSDLLSGIKK